MQNRNSVNHDNPENPRSILPAYILYLPAFKLSTQAPARLANQLQIQAYPLQTRF